MGLLCKMFGHRTACFEYGKVRLGTIDGIGRVHANVKAQCIRCDQWFDVAQIHIPNRDFRVEKRDGYYEYVNEHPSKMRRV